MNHNWNVYKVFKNGKRAKAPIGQFVCEGDDVEALSFFNESVKENFSGKNRGTDFAILRADLPQERIAEKNNLEEEKNLRNRSIVLGRLLRAEGITHKRRVAAALMLTKETDWKWQWCAAEAGTHKYIGGLSQKFNNHTEAVTWLEDQIASMG